MMNIKIDYSPVADFFLALTRVLCEEEFNDYEFGKSYVLSEDIQEYVEHAKTSINPILRRDLEYLCGHMARGLYFILFDSIKRGIDDMTTFFEVYEHIDTEEFLKIIYDSVDIEGIENMSHEEQRLAIEALFKEEQFHERGDDVNIYMDYIMYPDDISERLFKALKNYYDTFIAPREEQVRTFILKKLNEHRQLAQHDPNTLLEHIIMVLKKEDYKNKDVQMYINYYGELARSVSLNEERIMVIYGYSAEQRFDKNMRKKEYKDLLKTMSDDKRYDIIQLLGKRAWYSKELADELGITTATMSYHIKKIMILGIITVESGLHKRLYYSLNKEKFKNIIESMLSDMINE